MKREKIRHFLKITFGMLLIPIFFIVFISDRLIMGMYFWVPVEEWSKWIHFPKKVFKSLIRLTVYLAIYGLIKLIF